MTNKCTSKFLLVDIFKSQMKIISCVCKRQLKLMMPERCTGLSYKQMVHVAEVLRLILRRKDTEGASARDSPKLKSVRGIWRSYEHISACTFFSYTSSMARMQWLNMNHLLLLGLNRNPSIELFIFWNAQFIVSICFAK